MQYDEDHINLFESVTHKPKSILKNSNYSKKLNHSNSSSSLNEQEYGFKGSTPINHEELFIRGYASNLYRDDFNALKIETKSNLIPWNGDENLLIDKYDCRLHLCDLSPYDADLMTEYRKNPTFTQEEIEIENLCDKERYLDLENTLEPDVFETKNKYGAVGFNYEENSNQKPEESETKHEMATSQEKLFVPDENLKLPVGMLIPETVKMNQLMIRTASFISKQGLQAEILLKTKQSSNTQFNFLNSDNYLNPYYKHLIRLIQANKININDYLKEQTEIENNQNADKNETNNDTESDEEENYLHPLLSHSLNRNNSEDTLKTNKTEIEEKKEISEQNESVKTPDQMEDDGSKAVKSDSEISNNEEKHEEPTGNVKIIIDKLAEYVFKNGDEFESNMKQKNDPRFDFLNEDHKYFKYYKLQINNFKNEAEISDKDHKKNKKKTHSSESEESLKEEGKSDSTSSDSTYSEESDDEEKRKSHKRKSRRHHHHRRHKKSSSRRSQSSRSKHKKRSKDKT